MSDLSSRQSAELAFLLNNGVSMEIISVGGGLFDVSWVEYSLFMPEVQKVMAGVDNLDDFDGVHQLDCPDYVGYGDTLSEALTEFMDKNNEFCEMFNGSEEDSETILDQYVQSIKDKHEL